MTKPGQPLDNGAAAVHPAVTYNLVVVPGDGIGPEVIAAGRQVLEGAGRIFGFGIDWHEILIGGVAIDAYGVPLRDEDMAACAEADAVYFGAIGDPKYDDPRAKIRPEQALLALRKGLGLYANLRPVTVHPVLRASSPVREALLEGVDMMIVRELTGGLYFGKPSETRVTPAGRDYLGTDPIAGNNNEFVSYVGIGHGWISPCSWRPPEAGRRRLRQD